MTPDGADNGRVTLAVLSSDIKHLTEQMQNYCAQNAHWQELAEQRVRILERWAEVSAERWKTHIEEHREQRAATQTQNTITSIVSAAVMSAGAFIASQITGTK